MLTTADVQLPHSNQISKEFPFAALAMCIVARPHSTLNINDPPLTITLGIALVNILQNMLKLSLVYHGS